MSYSYNEIVKRKFLVPAAIILAVLLSSMTIYNTSISQISYVFDYSGSPISQSAVENEANWQFVSTNPEDISCDDIDQEACKLMVSSGYVEANGSGYTLLSSANVKAAFYNGPGANDSYYVTLTGSNVIAKSNHAHIH